MSGNKYRVVGHGVRCAPQPTPDKAWREFERVFAFRYSDLDSAIAASSARLIEAVDAPSAWRADRSSSGGASWRYI